MSITKEKLKRWIHRPQDPMKALVLRYKNALPDELYLKLLLFTTACYWPNLKHPKTYNEKLQWLKLHDHRPEYTTMVDKITSKYYVANIIGEQYIIPTLKVYKSVDEINLDELPEKFVLKTNHSGSNTGVIICKDKSMFDLDSAKKALQKSLETDMYPSTREWPYKNIKPQVFVEQFMENNQVGDLMDYKFFCFDGVVRALFIGSERESGDVKFDYYDADFNHLDLVQEHPMSGKVMPKPTNFNEMKEIAAKLSKGLPHARIDLYDVEGKIYFGEITFYHHGGIMPFHPKKWDYEFGSWIKLPEPNA